MVNSGGILPHIYEYQNIMEVVDIGTWITDLFNAVVAGFGSMGIIFAFFILVLFMIIQAIIAPIASEAVLTSAGGIFDKAFPTYGIAVALLGGIIGSLLGAITAFYMARWGQEMISRYVDSHGIREIKDPNLWHRFLILLTKFIDDESEDFARLIEEKGFLIVLVGRILPFVPFDAVSYGSGFTTIRFKDFMIATTIGTIPRVTFFVLLGTSLAGVVRDNGLLFLGLTALVGIVLYALYKLTTYLVVRRNRNDGMTDLEEPDAHPDGDIEDVKEEPVS